MNSKFNIQTRRRCSHDSPRLPPRWPPPLAGCEMGLKLAGVPVAGSGVAAAMDHLASHADTPMLKAAA
ncbi:hypothetical protein DN412_02485 [Cupriavidus lacunae]|uniref:Uncharacterized protein n=1 Tax=Cupriavidus lacunae TaxID=2666307 RepID=A0A370P1P3_9BURK|nr:hypothetical protein DN412_02485 [Cupriavidus lacunae]